MYIYFKNFKYFQIISNFYVFEEYIGVLNNVYFKYYINIYNILSFNIISINISIYKNF